jgi:hypothetical protein
MLGASAEAPRALPEAKLGATNVIVFMFMTTKRDVGFVENKLSQTKSTRTERYY